MNIITPGDIEKDTFLLVELKGGSRVAGRALSRIIEGRGLSWHVTVRRVTGERVRVNGEDVDRLATADVGRCGLV